MEGVEPNVTLVEVHPLNASAEDKANTSAENEPFVASDEIRAN